MIILAPYITGAFLVRFLGVPIRTGEFGKIRTYAEKVRFFIKRFGFWFGKAKKNN
jgi:hypothetical protein